MTGLIAQQQCCGPLQLPISDVAVMAQTHFGYSGAATAIGEQPLKVGITGRGASCVGSIASGFSFGALVWVDTESLLNALISTSLP